MKKQTTTKIILGLIIFVFVVSIFQFALPIQAATDTSMANLYSNPNQSGNSTYKFKISDVVSSGLLTNVVGCTGVVNKVSTWMFRFINSPFKVAEMAKVEAKKTVAQVKKSCAAIKAGTLATLGSVPFVNNLTDAGQATFESWCKTNVEGKDDDQIQLSIEAKQSDDEKKLKDQCFDGIAITLAKNQLTAMTRSMMNWVNSGYGGNPFFVQNMRNFTNNIERNVLETGIDILLAPKNQNPYASDFARSAITSRGLGSSSSNFLGTLQSDLGSFITDPKSYYTNGQLDQAMDTRDALERARDANYAFQNDFSVGGWNAYLALTQRDQNNPLGFTMLASQYLADTQMQQVSDARDELAQNNGFLSQKTCIKWIKYTIDGPVYLTTELKNMGVFETSPTKTSQYDQCAPDGWKIITPGSIIKEKTTNYLNSPERQLELVKTINDSLNALFSVLISKLQGGGLSGLSDYVTNAQMNLTDNLDEFTSPDGNTPYDNNGAYDGFNLTRDLGNTYIHGEFKNLGTWNAKACPVGQDELNNCNITKQEDKTKPTKLYADLGPGYYNAEDKYIPYGSNSYYTVTTAGNTKLLLEGYNGWAVDDRAFWDGKEWQNWKKGQTNPIDKRGVIQTQQDYIVAGKEILKILPSIMSKLGKLDYCLPGPNPSYKTNSTDAQSAYQDWVGSIYVGPIDTSNERFGVKIDKSGDRTYDNLQNIYADNTNIWNSIKISIEPLTKIFSIICTSGESGDDCKDSYFYTKDMDKWQREHLKDKTDLMNKTLDDVNNHLFQDFYKAFDEKMNELYFKNMTNKYSETEISSDLIPNEDYISMSVSGLDLTKNILFYNDDITKAVTDYTDAMAQAKINIAKLEPIKTEVSGIILAAQKRRNKNLENLLGLTASQIQTKYATCFAEENIKFYDADDITNMGSVDAERCFDGIDNDLDGLVDKKDSDCNPSSTSTNTDPYTNGDIPYSFTAICQRGSKISKNTAMSLQDRSSCSGLSRTECESSYENPALYKCFWGERATNPLE